MEHKFRSPESQLVGLDLLHGAMHLHTIKRLLLVLLFSTIAHCGISLLQNVSNSNLSVLLRQKNCFEIETSKHFVNIYSSKQFLSIHLFSRTAKGAIVC